MDDDDAFFWPDAWAGQMRRFRKNFIGSYWWYGDQLFRVLVSKQGAWLHLYGGPQNVCVAQIMLGGPEWTGGSFDWQCEEIIMAIRKRQASQGGGKPVEWKGDAESVLAYPALVERLTSQEFEDGSRRKPDTLTIMAIDRGWRCVLNDKETAEALWVGADSLVGLLEALEVELNADEPNWKAPPGSRQKRGK